MSYYKEMRKYVGTKPLILPGAAVVIVNDEGEILLQKRPDGRWGLPGGLMELGESMEEAAIREVQEETGLTVSNLQLLGIFSGEGYYIKLENGDEFYALTAVYWTDSFDGQMSADGMESIDLQFFQLDCLPKSIVENYAKFIAAFRRLIQ